MPATTRKPTSRRRLKAVPDPQPPVEAEHAARKLSLSEALVVALRTCRACGAQVASLKCEACGARLKAEPVKAVIDRALELWTSPAGKTPKATASAQLLYLTRDGLAAKPERGMVVAAFPKK